MPALAPLLEPDPHLRTLAVPTLFQALSDPANQSLRQVMRPVHTREADEVFARGEALRGLTEQPDAPKDLALIIDLPGPQSVALAAALATAFCPVFTFDNWPHPLGVVPSHLTLAPACTTCRVRRGASVPAASRAAHVRAGRQPAGALPRPGQPVRQPLRGADAVRGQPARRGSRRVLYIRPDDRSLTELDDLNGDFVAWQQAGIEVRALPLSDFTAEDVRFPARPTRVPRPDRPRQHGHYFYGGHSYHHFLFWRSYGYGVGPARTPSRV
jgi:hypothetical protein